MESAEYYKQFLLKIYRCKQPFEVVLRDRVTQKNISKLCPLELSNKYIL